MNFNPFSQHTAAKRLLSRGRSKLNMFDRTVGRPESMGIFDYLLVVPFLNKLALDAVDGKSKVLQVLFGIISIPLAITKLGLYLGTSPLILTAWAIKEGVKKKKEKNRISQYTADINALLVRAPANAHQDPDKMPVVPLSALRKLHDVELGRFSIKTNQAGEIILTTFPGNTTVAAFVTTRENIVAMQKLMGPLDQNRLDYFLANAGKNIFNFSAVERANEIAKQQATNMTTLIHKLLVTSTPENPDATSFTAIPKEVRRMIAKQVMLNDIDIKPDDARKSTFFASFNPKESEAAVLEYVSENKIR